jgi:Ser/Thr protein kinase RdoA (MazF antagonist)
MDAIMHAPALTPADAADLARRLYGIDAGASPLPSERDQNFLLRAADGNRFVLKIANATDDRALLDAQNGARRRTHDANDCDIGHQALRPRLDLDRGRTARHD